MKKKKSTARSGLFGPRPLLALFLCAAAICSVIFTGTLLAFWRSELPAKASQTTLTFTERVANQRAIEEVYWRHRIWPKECPDPKPSLDRVMSQAQLEKKVQDYLRNSQALEDYWRRPITAEQLQAEMDRMARDTKQPEVLRELFEELGNDPFVIAECLARPILAERLSKSAVAPQDASEVHKPIKFVKPSNGPLRGYTLPVIATALKKEGTCNDVWAATTTANAPTAREWHTAVWTATEMITWGGWDSANYLNTGGKYNPSTDSWTATGTTNAPSARARHTAVWTGTEMIVWGGIDPDYLNTGGRYNPVTDSWVPISLTNTPSARLLHTAVWTGIEMIVWGGKDVSEFPSNTGGRYNPSTDSWTATSTTNVPAARFYHTAVWTGSEMIAWGGEDFSGAFNTGGRYNASTDTWTATNTTDAPAARYFHTAVWTGDEMVVWGGYNGCNLNTGGRYDPSTDTWTATNTTNAPTARDGHSALWAGSEMIVWGGYIGYDQDTNTGGRYNPAANTWTATSTTNAPTARDEHTAVWTGGEMIVWGGIDAFGLTNTGGRYCDQQPIARLTPSRTPRPTASSIVSSVPTFTRTATAAATSTPCTPVLLLIETFDNVTPPQLPPGWTAVNAIDPDRVPWVTSNSGGPLPPADSPPNAAYINDPSAISDKRLQSPSIFLSEGSQAVQITFSNNFNLQAGFDGGVLEISIDGGATFQDILARGNFISGGYNGMISACSDNPLAGRQAWTGNSGDFITTTVSLPVVTWGSEMILRWRMVSDSTVFGEGWRIDTLIVSQCQQMPTPTPTPSVTPTATPTTTATPTPTATSTPRVTPTPRIAPTPRSRPTQAPRP